MRWAAIVPLIGGQVVGTRDALGSDPEFMLSYPDFAGNDRYIRRYLPDVPFHLLPDGLRDVRGKWAGKLDLLVSTCPCAGLSMLSPHKAGSPQRAEKNAWMLKTTELVLSELRPQALLGENAPQLATRMGTDVRDGLAKLAEDHGYVAQFVKVSTTMTGIPQHRERAFYYLTRGKTAPVLQWETKPLRDLQHHLEYYETVGGAPAMDVPFMHQLSTDPMYVFLQEKFGSHWRNPDRSNRGYSDALGVFHRDHSLFAEFCDRWPTRADYTLGTSYDSAQAHTVHRVWDKLQNAPGTGCYVMPPIFARGPGWYPAVTAKTLERLVHPGVDRYLTYGEVAHGLMGLPLDFELPPVQHYNIICQNVPTWTAAEATRALIPFLEGRSAWHVGEGPVLTDFLRGREPKFLSSEVTF